MDFGNPNYYGAVTVKMREKTMMNTVKVMFSF